MYGRQLLGTLLCDIAHLVHLEERVLQHGDQIVKGGIGVGNRLLREVQIVSTYGGGLNVLCQLLHCVLQDKGRIGLALSDGGVYQC